MIKKAVFTILIPFCFVTISHAQGSATKIRSADLLPATCTPGSPNVAADAIVVSGVLYNCTATGWSEVAGDPSKEISPWLDIRAYGARAINTHLRYSTTGSVTQGTNILALAAASVFQNGDGISILNAGATNSMATPSAPTVRPSIAAFATGSGIVVDAPVGGKSFAYEIVAIRKGGGYTLASTPGSTSTGGTLGPANISITSLARSGSTVTVTTSAPHTLARGAAVHISGTSDSSFVGWYIVSASSDNTHFAYVQGISTNGDNAPTSANGGTASWFNCNHITWSAVTGAWIYAIYGRTGGTFNFLGYSRPTGSTYSENFFDDFGSPMMDNPLRPAWFPSTAGAISSAKNDMLTTTISSGGGTTRITLAANAINSASSDFTVFDDAPALFAAAQDANTKHSTVYIPASGTLNFPISSYTILPAHTTLRLSGGLYLGDTLEVGNSTRMIGSIDNGGTAGAADSMVAGAAINVASFPGIYANTASSSIFEGLAVSWTGTNNALLFLADGCISCVWKMDNFSTGTNNSDTMGISMVWRAPSDFFDVQIDTSAFEGGPDENTFDSTSTPQLLTVATPFTNGIGNVYMHHVVFYQRGMGWATPNTDSTVYVHTSHFQGGLVPFFSTASHFGQLTFNQSIIDSTPEPVVANLSGTLYDDSVYLYHSFNASIDAGSSGLPGSVSGNPFVDLHVLQIPFNAQIGQNLNESDCNTDFINIPVYGASQQATCKFRMPIHFPSQHTMYWDLTPVTGVGAVVSAGGSVPSGAHSYVVTAQGPDGGYTQNSAKVSAIATLGVNQTVTVSWKAKQGAMCYNIYRDGALSNSASCLTTNSYVDTYSSTFGGSSDTAGGTGTAGGGPNGFYAPEFDLIGVLSGNVSYKGRFVQPALTATRTYKVPDASITVSGATVYYCGATSGATQGCAQTVRSLPIIIFGDVTLNRARSQSITMLPYTGAGTYSCSGSDLTTTAGIVSFNSYTSSSVNITESGGVNMDHLRYMCVGY